jgi:hypothetical protein
MSIGFKVQMYRTAISTFVERTFKKISWLLAFKHCLSIKSFKISRPQIFCILMKQFSKKKKFPPFSEELKNRKVKKKRVVMFVFKEK